MQNYQALPRFPLPRNNIDPSSNEIQQERNKVYCVSCGSQLQSFPDPHDCIKIYDSKLNDYQQIYKDYDLAVTNMARTKQEIEKMMTELETIDSKIKAQNEEATKNEQELGIQEHKLKQRLGIQEFERFKAREY